MLPAKVHEKNNRYYYVERNKWHKLSRTDEGPEALLDALQAHTGERPATYGQMMLLYLRRGMQELKPATRPEYKRIIAVRLSHHFGHMVLGSLKPGHIAQYLEQRKADGAPVGANRERAVLSAVIAWAMRFGWIESNPCHGVKRNRETPSRRYVTHQELMLAVDAAPEPLQDLLGVAYLSGLRQGDLRELRIQSVGAELISLRQSKDGKLTEIEITPSLRYFLDRAMARARAAGSDFVFVGQYGRPWSMDGLQSAMRRLAPGFRFRDLRPKAASDSPHNTLGHDQQMLKTYIRARRLKPVK